MKLSSTITLIVGAGPAGLAIGGRLRNRKLPFEIVEQSESIASSWKNHYDRLHLHTVKKYSALPFVPFPDSYPQYVSRQQVVTYAEEYARHFNIEPHFSRAVQTITKSDASWQVTFDSGKSIFANNVVVATGTNRIPVSPAWTGAANFDGKIIHSREYKNAQPYDGKRVLVIGMGNTGAEIALDLAEHNIATTISVRRPVNIVPRDAFGRPTQLTALKLARLPAFLQDSLGRLTQRLTVGNLEKFGLPLPEIAPMAQLRKHGKSPVIDVGTVAAIKAGKIQVKPGVESLDGKRISFTDGTTSDYDIIILATGYKSGIASLVPAADRMLDYAGNPRKLIGTDDLDGLYFLGFDNYRPGGILGIINTDSKKIAEHLASK